MTPRNGFAPLPPLPADPLVSVLIVNYNYDRYLGAAIASAREQTYKNLEIVICDDGSIDRSREIILQHASEDPRIKYIFKENAGVAAALNDSFRASRGEIIALLDADDLFVPDKLEKIVGVFTREPAVGLVIDTLTKIDAEGNRLGRLPEFGRYDRGDLRHAVLQSSGYWFGAPTSAMSIRRECAARVFPIPEEQFRTEADAYMRAIAALYFPVELIEEPLTCYRIHSSNLTAPATIDAKFCAKGISATERIFAVVSSEASQNGWEVAPLSTNPAYREMLVIRDYLDAKPVWERLRSARALMGSAANLRTPHRLKAFGKAAVVAAASLLPRRLGHHILNQVYLPTPLKASISRWYRGAARRA